MIPIFATRNKAFHRRNWSMIEEPKKPVNSARKDPFNYNRDNILPYISMVSLRKRLKSRQGTSRNSMNKTCIRNEDSTTSFMKYSAYSRLKISTRTIRTRIIQGRVYSCACELKCIGVKVNSKAPHLFNNTVIKRCFLKPI
jgi:hypothetical protein